MMWIVPARSTMSVGGGIKLLFDAWMMAMQSNTTQVVTVVFHLCYGLITGLITAAFEDHAMVAMFRK